MAEQRNYSPYQQKVISRYYENRDQVDEQRLAELATNLYLATGKKRAKHWETAREIMTRMKLPISRIEHVCGSDNPALLAEVIQEIQTGKLRIG